MADVNVRLAWTGQGLQFDGGRDNGPTIHMDGGGDTGPGPMATLLLAFGGCMAADVVDISTKSRLPLTGLEVTVEGDRAPEPPRRYTRIVMKFVARGVAKEDEPKLQRALDLSQEKYCSVLHSLREDTAMEFHLELA